MSKLTLKHDKKLGIIYHPDSSLVVKSAEEKRIVVGRVENGEVKGVDDETIALCKKYEQYGFTIPQSTESDSENESGDEPEGDESEGDESEGQPVTPHVPQKKEEKGDVSVPSPLPVKEYTKPSSSVDEDVFAAVTAQISSIKTTVLSLKQDLARKTEELLAKSTEIERLKASLADKDQQLAKIKSIFA